MKNIRPNSLNPWMLSALVSGASLVACSDKGKDSAAAVQANTTAPIKVPLTKATVASAPIELTITGLVAADQRADVSADTSGKVLQVMVDRGERVKQGAPLVRLDTRTAALGANEARANLAAVRAQRELAEQECKKSETLLNKGAITQSQYDREKTSCTAALQQVAAAEARVAMIVKSVSDGLVRAPFDGLVTQKMAQPGMFVGPGVPLVTLVDDDPLHVDLAVPEGAYSKIKKDQAVTVEATAFPGQIFSATIVRIGGEVGRMNRSIVAEAKLASGTPLLPGMFAECRLSVGSQELPAIPKSALVKRGRTHRVFVAVSGTLEERVVQTGPALDDKTVTIRQGVAAGESVVTTITKDVVDGAVVVQ